MHLDLRRRLTPNVGYRAMGVAVGKKLDGDAAAFTVADTRLFLSVNEKIRGMGARDIATNEVTAQKRLAEVPAHAGFDSM